MAQNQVNDSPLASLLPDEMIAGGLPDDFDGTVREARYAPFDYDGNIEKPVLAIRLKIERHDVDADADEKERFIAQHWSAGALEHFRPSVDGVNPTGGEGMGIEPGFFAIRVGQRTALNNNTNAAQLMRSFLDAGVKREQFRADVRFMEGLKGHWNRLPPDKKGGQFKDQTPEQKEKASKRDVLVLTRFDGISTSVTSTTASASTAGAGTSKPAAGANGSVGGSVDAKLVEIVLANIKPGAAAIKKSALSGIVLKSAKADKDVNKMVKRVTESDFLSGLAEHLIMFDADEGTVSRLADEA